MKLAARRAWQVGRLRIRPRRSIVCLGPWAADDASALRPWGGPARLTLAWRRRQRPRPPTPVHREIRLLPLQPITTVVSRSVAIHHHHRVSLAAQVHGTSATVVRRLPREVIRTVVFPRAAASHARAAAPPRMRYERGPAAVLRRAARLIPRSFGVTVTPAPSAAPVSGHRASPTEPSRTAERTPAGRAAQVDDVTTREVALVHRTRGTLEHAGVVGGGPRQPITPSVPTSRPRTRLRRGRPIGLDRGPSPQGEPRTGFHVWRQPGRAVHVPSAAADSESTAIVPRGALSLVWRTPAPAASERTAETAGPAARGPAARGPAVHGPAVQPVTRSQAAGPQTRAQAAEAQPAAPALTLSPAAVDRLAEDVMRRIDKRLRIERERRGL